MSYMTLILALLFVINPIGNLKTFMSLMDTIRAERRMRVFFRECSIALCIMLFFALTGGPIAHVFEFSATTIAMSAGAILFMVAIKIIFPPKEDFLPKVHGEEHYVVPIALPVFASPALLASIMLFAQATPCIYAIIISVLVAWSISTLCFFYANRLSKLLTNGGLLAIERLMGIVLIFIAVQRFMEGITLFLHNG